MSITTRKAILADMKAVRDLVVELAIYEKEPNAVTASLEDYQQDFSNGWFECHLAEDEQEVVGMILYYNTYSTWKGRMLYLEDFVVKQSHRRKGIGKILFKELFNIAQAKDARLIKWQVLDWNKPAIEFYKSYEATIEKEWYNCKILMA